MTRVGLYPQIQKGDPRNCAIFIPAWGLKWGIRVFSHNHNNRDSLGACVLRSEHEDKHVDAFWLRLFPRVWSAKTRIPPIWAPWLMKPLHGVVYEVWDLPYISVTLPENIWLSKVSCGVFNTHGLLQSCNTFRAQIKLA